MAVKAKTRSSMWKGNDSNIVYWTLKWLLLWDKFYYTILCIITVSSSLIIQKIVGCCTKYNVKSCYGFIEITLVCDESNNNNSGHLVSYFAHHFNIVDPAIQYGYPKLSKGGMVIFEAKRDTKWKWRGTNIQKARPHQAERKKNKKK